MHSTILFQCTAKEPNLLDGAGGCIAERDDPHGAQGGNLQEEDLGKKDIAPPIEKTHACNDLDCFCFKFGISFFCFAKMAALASPLLKCMALMCVT